VIPFIAAVAAACITSPGVTAHRLSPLFGSGSALGRGPVYPVVALRDGALPLYDHGSWYVQKGLWIARPGKQGVTVTLGPGARFVDVDAGGGLRLRGRSLRVPARAAWRGYPSEIALRRPSCLHATLSTGGRLSIRTRGV
jgi:hypothetical protein